MTVLKTERLMLRPMVAADAEAYAAMRYHPEVAKWLPPGQGDPVDGARTSIERFAGAWRDRGYSPWGVFLGEALIGHAGLNYVPEFEQTEVLWALHPDHWGKGYATEVAHAALGFGFDNAGLELIFAITLPENVSSQAVMKRLGLTYRRRVDYKGFKDIVWFDMDRRTWSTSR